LIDQPLINFILNEEMPAKGSSTPTVNSKTNGSNISPKKPGLSSE